MAVAYHNAGYGLGQKLRERLKDDRRDNAHQVLLLCLGSVCAVFS